MLIQKKTFLILDEHPENNRYIDTRKPTFKFKYLGQALFFNHHFLVMILVGFFGMIFTPLKTEIDWVNESIDFLNALTLGIGASGVICWIFVYKLKKDYSRGVSSPVWVSCYLLLNVCHILSVFFVLGFFAAVGIKQNGNISALACGVFVSLIAGIMLSIKYAYKS